MRTLARYLVVSAAAALVVGCGGGSSSGVTSPTGRTADSGGALCKSTSCAAQQNYYTCLKSKCGTQAQTCFGSSYASGQFSGPCAAFATCNMACPCDGTGDACLATCFTSSATAECQACIGTITTCATTSGCQQGTCTVDSGTTTNTGTNTSTGTGCTAALACCTALAGSAGGASLVQQCQTALAGQTDAVCAQVVAAYKQAGLCP